MTSLALRRALRVTLDSGDSHVIDASQITDIQAMQRRTLIECGRMVYVVRETPLAIKLQLREANRSARVPTTTTTRVYSA